MTSLARFTDCRFDLMRISRIHTPQRLLEGASVSLSPSAANHVARVLRLGVGDVIGVFDGEGAEHKATIAASKGNEVVVRVGEAVMGDVESPLRTVLVQGVSRGERMDWVVQKATELGVTSIVPVLTARSVVKLDAEQAAKKREHWLSIAVSACEQCGRNRLPDIASPLTLASYLRLKSDATRLILDPKAEQSLMTLPTTKSVDLLIGPEGGLDDAEIASATNSGFASVKIGPRILRTETAAVAAVAMLQGRFGDLR